MLLEIKNLNAGYEDLQVLKNVNLELEKGKMSVLMGPNGAGKSTILKSIFNITNITSGDIFFEGKKITKFPAHKLMSKGIAFVPQGKVNFDILSVRDNLLMGIHQEKDKTLVKRRLDEVYTQFPVLKEKEEEYAFALSGGQQQMLAIGRALMSSPKLLLMDEPSLGLAPKLVKEMFGFIKDIRDNFDTTILVVEHNLKSMMNVADDGYVLVQGEIIAHDSCDNLKNSNVMKEVFVGEFE
jgi:branched-chain amino acid transport system ATP-binding protein